MGQRTPLYDAHLAAGAKMVDFGGWDMPIHYGSQLEEHHAVRQGVGLFDVSHMTVVDVAGKDTRAYLRRLLANDLDKVGEGRALYTCMLNERGGVVDDLIVYKIAADQARLVVNCATRDKDLDWMEKQAGGFAVDIQERPDLAMLAVQGPKARAFLQDLVCDDARAALGELPFFGFAQVGSWLIARTGYTGEDGAEIILPGDKAPELWQRLTDAGARPAGLGARDTLRLEAGLNLYGNDMDDGVTPWEANLGWTVALDDPDRDFVGRAALETQKQKDHPVLRGLVLEGKGVLRPHQGVHVAGGSIGPDGETTSGTFSPTLGRAIAFARLPAGTTGTVEVEIRNKRLVAQVVKPPFVKKGQRAYKPV